MGVDVAPVHDIEAGQPAQGREHRYGVAAAQYRHRRSREREREICDLVLDDVNPVDAIRRHRELGDADKQFGESAKTSRYPEANMARLARKPVAPGTIRRGYIYPGKVELRVE